MVTAPAGTRKSSSGAHGAVREGWAMPQRSGNDLCRDLDFQEFVVFTPEGQPHQPVLAAEDTLGFGPLGLGQNASAAGGLWTGDFAADGAGGNLNLRIVADALVLPGVIASHKIESAVAFREPNGRGDGGAVLAECGKGEILASSERRGDCH